jgi:hypothetical protein
MQANEVSAVNVLCQSSALRIAEHWVCRATTGLKMLCCTRSERYSTLQSAHVQHNAVPHVQHNAVRHVVLVMLCFL